MRSKLFALITNTSVYVHVYSPFIPYDFKLLHFLATWPPRLFSCCCFFLILFYLILNPCLLSWQNVCLSPRNPRRQRLQLWNRSQHRHFQYLRNQDFVVVAIVVVLYNILCPHTPSHSSIYLFGCILQCSSNHPNATRYLCT